MQLTVCSIQLWFFLAGKYSITLLHISPMWFRRLKIAWVEERDFNNWFSRRGCFPFIGIPSHDPTSGRARPPGTGSAIHIWAMQETLIYSSSSQHRGREGLRGRGRQRTNQSRHDQCSRRLSAYYKSMACKWAAEFIEWVREKEGLHRLGLTSAVSDTLTSNWSIFLFVWWN